MKFGKLGLVEEKVVLFLFGGYVEKSSVEGWGPKIDWLILEVIGKGGLMDFLKGATEDPSTEFEENFFICIFFECIQTFNHGCM